MVHLNIELEIVREVVFPQEVEASSCVKIVLVLAGFHGFGLDEESTFKAILASIVLGHMEKAGHMVKFSLHSDKNVSSVLSVMLRDITQIQELFLDPFLTNQYEIMQCSSLSKQ